MKNLYVILAMFFCIHLCAIWAWASCGELPGQINSANQAQSQINQSLIENHEDIAVQIEKLAWRLEHSRPNEIKKIVQKLRAKAAAIRDRADAAKIINHKYTELVNEIERDAQSCKRTKKSKT